MDWSVKLAKSLRKDSTLQRHYFIQLICQLAIALCITTILISSFLIRGFEETIENKIFNFWSHIRISNISNSENPIGEKPINLPLDDFNNSGIKEIIPVVNKGVLLKNKENIEGIVLRGIYLNKQHVFDYSKETNSHFNIDKELPIVLSQYTLDKLDLKKGSSLFVTIPDSSTTRTIRAKVINTYCTHIEEFDARMALTDIHILQKINRWNDQDYSWIEIQASNIQNIRHLAKELYQDFEDVSVDTIYDIYPQLFDWLALMKKNEIIIFIVMLIVAIVNIISTIHIFVLEKTKLIGMLKVLGARNRPILKMMYYQVFLIILRGIIIGNAATLTITAILYYIKPIKLDPSVYYVAYAPILFDWKAFIFINLLTIIVCIISAYIPLRTIQKISPIKVVEYN